MKKLYALQGVIFQYDLIFGIGYRPEMGSVATIQEAIIYVMFHGIMEPDEEADNDTFRGHMSDKWGDSIITDFKISDTELSFTKKYKNRDDIFYRFTKKEGIWSGSFEGRDCGEGICRCIVNEIDESFFSFEENKLNEKKSEL